MKNCKIYFVALTAGLLAVHSFTYAQTITTIVGDGTSGYSGDGGSATAAGIGTPFGIAIDSSGNLYIADVDHNVIRKVCTSGIISTVAGNGSLNGYSGDGGPATNARLAAPYAVAVDNAGNIYIADYHNYCIRRVSPLGIISTFAGTATVSGYSGDGGPATSARLTEPRAVAADHNGNIYIADQHNSVVRKVSSGIITTIAGTGISGYSGDGGPATAAQLKWLTSLAVDYLGNVFLGDYVNRGRMINTSGIINTIVGQDSTGYAGDGGPGANARIRSIAGIAFDGMQNIFFSDNGNNVIREINYFGTINTVAGCGIFGFAGDDGPAILAQFRNPCGIVVDKARSIYVCDAGNSRIRKITAPTAIRNINEATYEINLYPNPTQGEFSITLPQTSDQKTILITDMLGHIIETRSVSGSQTQSFQLSTPPGLYTVKVICGSENYYRQLVIW